MDDVKRLAVLVIDMQREYFQDGPLKVPEGDRILQNVKRIIQAAREKAREGGCLLVHVRHISKDPYDSTFRAGTRAVEFMEEVERREIKSLLKASDLLKCKDLLVITWDYEDEEMHGNRRVRFMPLWKWLLKI